MFFASTACFVSLSLLQSQIHNLQSAFRASAGAGPRVERLGVQYSIPRGLDGGMSIFFALAPLLLSLRPRRDGRSVLTSLARFPRSCALATSIYEISGLRKFTCNFAMSINRFFLDLLLRWGMISSRLDQHFFEKEPSTLQVMVVRYVSKCSTWQMAAPTEEWQVGYSAESSRDLRFRPRHLKCHDW